MEIAWKFTCGPSWVWRIRIWHQIHGLWGGFYRKFKDTIQERYVAAVGVHCAISVRSSASRKISRCCFQLTSHDVSDSIFVDFRSICQSRTLLENASHLWSAYFLSTPDELRDDWRRVWKLRSRLITSRRHPACILYNFSPENAIPKTSATSSKVPRRLPLSKIRVAHGRPNFCFLPWLEISRFLRLF